MERKTIFMDLQGTLGGDPMGDITSFDFYPRALDALKALSVEGCRMIVVTNQSRIAKGIITKEIYASKQAEIEKMVHENGIDALEFYCCPHNSVDDCACKKPKTEFFERANAIEYIDKANCYMIGDMGMSDMLFAHNLGISKVLVRTGVGQGSLDAYRSTWASTEPEFIANDMYDAAMWILKRSV